ncbi:MAG: extracellular solute-binding protein [Clostridia bacterium]|nr:extracellular solute-binding protein [Clostridia bacterium]
MKKLCRIMLACVLAMSCMMAPLAYAEGLTEDPIVIDIFRVAHPSSSLTDLPEEGFPVDQLVEEMFNVKLEVRYVPATNANDIYNTMMAANEVNTLVQNTFANLDKYADAWATLNDYIVGKYANLEAAYFDDPFINAQTAMENGDVRILSTLYSQKQGDILLVRGDLVEKYDVDISEVNTKEEWTDLLAMIKEEEPDVVPYGTRYQRPGLTNRLAFGWSGINEDFFTEDDTVKFGCTDERMYEVIEWLRDMYAEGLIDVDYPTSTTTEWQEKVLGRGIFLTHDNPSSRMDWALTQWESLGYTDRYYMPVAPIYPEEGVPGKTVFQYPSFQDSWAISKNASPETIDRIMQIFDYGFTDEGYVLYNWGIEGVYFDYVDGKPVVRPEYSDFSQGNKGIALCFTRRVYNGIEFSSNPRVLEAQEMYVDGGLIIPNYIQMLRLTEDELKVYNTLYPDIKTYMDENLDAFIFGTKELNPENWDEFVAGFDALGLEEVLEAYNAALDRIMVVVNKE